jgi:hypothetical protein
MTYTPSDSSWLITNAAGDETAFYGYDAFGNLAFGTPESPFGYAGEYTDPSTGLSEPPWKSWRLHSLERTMEPCLHTTGRGIRLR